MKRLSLVLLLLALLSILALAWIILAPKKVTANPSPSPDARAAQIIHDLNLKPLPRESGYLGIIGDSAQNLTDRRPSSPIQSQVYYMLTRDRPINYLHWLASDDTHILIEGGPVDYFIFHPDGTVENRSSAATLPHGQRPVVAIPGGCWKALRLHPGAAYALMANALSPEWTPDRVKIGAGHGWVSNTQAKLPGPHRKISAR